jgi:hypothetical protein
MPRTLRELVWAYRGKEFAEWERLSALLCLLANVNRDPKKRRRPFSPHDFFRRPGTKAPRRGTALTGESFRAMKGLFVKKRDG